MATKEEARASKHSNGDMDNATRGVTIDVVNPKPRIGLFGAVTFGLGCMIGSGIFISPKGALHNAGSVGMALVMWALGGVISLIVGLVYCELGAILPHSGGDFAYINKGIGAIPAFLSVWTSPLFINTASTAVLSLVFADYFIVLVFGTCTPPGELRKVIGAVHILTLCISNIASVKLGVYVQMVCTVAKTLALAVIAIAGIVFMAKGSTENLENSFEGSATDATDYCLAIYSCMFAYAGYIHIGEIAEELKEPKKDIPRAIVISVLTATTIYILTNVSYFVLLPKNEFLSSNAVAYDWALKGIAPVAALIPLFVMCSVYGANNGGAFSVSRVMFAAARKDMYPEVFSFLHVDQSLPIIPIIVYHVISLLMLLPGDIGRLINFLNFMSFLTMFSASISLIRLKWQLRNNESSKERLNLPMVVPFLAVIITLFLIIAPFATSPRIEFIYSVAFVLGGLVLYVPFVYFRLRLPGMDRLTVLMQLICNICPTEKID